MTRAKPRNPFLKSSWVFNRTQLTGYELAPVTPGNHKRVKNLADVDCFVSNTKAIIKHKSYRAASIPSLDKI